MDKVQVGTYRRRKRTIHPTIALPVTDISWSFFKDWLNPSKILHFILPKPRKNFKLTLDHCLSRINLCCILQSKYSLPLLPSLSPSSHHPDHPNHLISGNGKLWLWGQPQNTVWIVFEILSNSHWAGNGHSLDELRFRGFLHFSSTDVIQLPLYFFPNFYEFQFTVMFVLGCLKLFTNLTVFWRL